MVNVPRKGLCGERYPGNLPKGPPESVTDTKLYMHTGNSSGPAETK